MRILEEVSDAKARGGFYSPQSLVATALDRVAKLVGSRTDLKIFEPSAGDGAFVRGVAVHTIRKQVLDITAVELIPGEAAKVRTSLADLNLKGTVVAANLLEWKSSNQTLFDVAIGNPPYIRFQFLNESDRKRSKEVSEGLGLSSLAVSNLWIPVLLLSLSRLKEGGAFSFILPMECFTGVAARQVRTWLIANTDHLTVDLFEPRRFPDVLQEVVLLSGRRQSENLGAREASVQVIDHDNLAREWHQKVSIEQGTWTHLLMEGAHSEALEAVQEMGIIQPLGDVAKFTVSTVTGANAYFCLSSEVVEKYNLWSWAKPLLPRTRYAEGLTFTSSDHLELSERGDVPSWILDFSSISQMPAGLAETYLETGVELGIHNRFKCRVRTPWYRVPIVSPGSLLMAKRSNRFPRIIRNDARVITTDTIYRGEMVPGAQQTPADLVATFHNSLTLLTAELYGRSFGGGVLELVPSEISSLMVFKNKKPCSGFESLDSNFRLAKNEEEILHVTDSAILSNFPELDREIFSHIVSARQRLMNRRLSRSNP